MLAHEGSLNGAAETKSTATHAKVRNRTGTLDTLTKRDIVNAQ